MTRPRNKSGRFTKPVLYGLLALTGGIVLLILSQVVAPATTEPEVAASTTAPAENGEPASDEPAPDKGNAAAFGLSNLLLLFSAACILIFLICIGWLVVEIRKARPAWKTQTKYPRMR